MHSAQKQADLADRKSASWLRRSGLTASVSRRLSFFVERHDD